MESDPQPLEVFLKQSERIYCTYQALNVMLITWNVGGKQLPQQRSFHGENNLFALNGNNPPPDILAIGLQEIVDLNA